MALAIIPDLEKISVFAIIFKHDFFPQGMDLFHLICVCEYVLST